MGQPRLCSRNEQPSWFQCVLLQRGLRRYLRRHVPLKELERESLEQQLRRRLGVGFVRDVLVLHIQFVLGFEFEFVEELKLELELMRVVARGIGLALEVVVVVERRLGQLSVVALGMSFEFVGERQLVALGIRLGFVVVGLRQLASSMLARFDILRLVLPQLDLDCTNLIGHSKIRTVSSHRLTVLRQQEGRFDNYQLGLLQSMAEHIHHFADRTIVDGPVERLHNLRSIADRMNVEERHKTIRMIVVLHKTIHKIDHPNNRRYLHMESIQLVEHKLKSINNLHLIDKPGGAHAG